MDLEEIYANIPHINANRNTVGPQKQSLHRTEAQNSKRSRWFVLITVFLGIICVLLMVSVIVLYIYLTADRDQMKISYMNIAEDHNETLSRLKVNCSRLTAEKDQLQKNLNSMNQKKLELETSYRNLTAEKDQLEKNLNSMNQKNLELENRIKQFKHPNVLKSCSTQESDRYYISSEEKSWSDSRQFCKNRGEDLIIINTEEEQKCISSMIKGRVWIGLSDIEQEGNMKWVDNTLLNKGFWANEEPNDKDGKEDCVEIINFSLLNNWNDLPCSEKRKWVCEN